MHAFPDGRLESRGVALEVGRDLVPGHEAVWVAAVVCPVGQLDRPVRRDEAEAVPAVPPRLADPPAFEDDVLDPRLREHAARRQAGLPGPDDRYRDVLHSVRTSRFAEDPSPRRPAPLPRLPSRRSRSCRGSRSRARPVGSSWPTLSKNCFESERTRSYSLVGTVIRSAQSTSPHSQKMSNSPVIEPNAWLTSSTRSLTSRNMASFRPSRRSLSSTGAAYSSKEETCPVPGTGHVWGRVVDRS